MRTEAAECIRELIEEIRLVPEKGKLRIELFGKLTLRVSCAAGVPCAPMASSNSGAEGPSVHYECVHECIIPSVPPLAPMTVLKSNCAIISK
jgi:hypothetical protein